jgi:GNAT superfamily N-acetyltransferase
MNLQIREAEDSDAEAISTLLSELGHPLDAASVLANLKALRARSPDFTALVALLHGTVIGLVTAFSSPVLHRPRPVGRVSILVVNASHTGHGVGSALLNRAEVFLIGRGCARIELTSAAHRHLAHEFYLRRGYQQQGVRFAKIPSDTSPA